MVPQRRNSSQQYRVTTNANGVRSIEVADLDGDHDYDVLASLLSDSALCVSKRRFSGVFTQRDRRFSLGHGAHTSVPADWTAMAIWIFWLELCMPAR